MSARTTPPFRADHVGSLLRPAHLLQAREDHAAGRIDADELREIEAQGESEFVVRLRGDGEDTESWFRLSPGLREELGLEVDDEELVRRTVRFLLGHQDAADFPDIVEIEDVVAGYPDYLDAVRG